MFFSKSFFPLASTVAVFALGFLAFVRQLPAQQQAPVPAVDPADRAAVVNHYRAYYLPSVGLDPAWTGDLATGNPGTVSDAFRQGAVRRINYFRTMSGLGGDITLDAAANAKCQQAALMMAAQQNISHAPPATWKFYTTEAAEACANSDIRLDWQGDEGALAIDKFIADDEDNNTSVGHRRWLLYAGQKVMAVGAVPGDGWTYPGTNATWVTSVIARPANAPQATSWPPAGFVPAALVYRRWSYSYLNADFSQTVVSVTKNGVGLAVTQSAPEYQTTATGGGSSWEGDNTLVWTLPGNEVGTTGDETYRVTLDRVLIAGVSQRLSYTVTTINPDAPTVGLTAPRPIAVPGGKKGKLLVTRSGDLSSPLTVNYTVGGTARRKDFGPLPGTVTIGAGLASARIRVTATPDRPEAAGKTVVVTLLPAAGVVLQPAATMATATIAAQP